jgi:two-component system, OmpR family, heavy metal sensor histidine kinase CusS
VRSLRGRLSVWLLAGTGLLLGGGGLFLDWTIRAQVRQDFDGGLLAEARSMMAVTEQEGQAISVELSPGLMPEFDAGRRRPDYYQVWVDGGRVLARSPSLRGATLPRSPAVASNPRFADLVLPDGRPGRSVQVTFQPQIEPDDERETARLGGGRPVHLAATLVVARGSEARDAFLASFHWTLVLFGAGLLLGSALLVWAVTQFALRPLDDLARRLRAMDAGSLGEPLAIAGAPSELLPTIAHLDDLLARLAASFERERTFSANVAHELRTPLAELRTVSEVALRWQGDAAALRAALGEVHGVGLQMERVVVNLLALARCDSGQHRVHTARVELRDTVDRCWRCAAAEATPGGAMAALAVPVGFAIVTDAEKLELILANLFANAIAYGVAGEPIACAVGAADGRFHLSVSNRTAELVPQDLPRLFDRFWRKDQARSDGGHAGLGLSLVAALCELLGFSREARLEGDVFQVVVSGPLHADH